MRSSSQLILLHLVAALLLVYMDKDKVSQSWREVRVS